EHTWPQEFRAPSPARGEGEIISCLPLLYDEFNGIDFFFELPRSGVSERQPRASSLPDPWSAIQDPRLQKVTSMSLDDPTSSKSQYVVRIARGDGQLARWDSSRPFHLEEVRAAA